MRSSALAILAGSLLLSSAIAAGAMESGPATATRTVTVAAASDDFAAKKSEYEHQAQQQYDSWRAKMSDLAARAKAKSVTLSTSAQAELDQAWDDAKLRWGELEKTSAEGWDKARTAWEQAADKMKRTWQRTVNE